MAISADSPSSEVTFVDDVLASADIVLVLVLGCIQDADANAGAALIPMMGGKCFRINITSVTFYVCPLQLQLQLQLMPHLALLSFFFVHPDIVRLQMLANSQPDTYDSFTTMANNANNHHNAFEVAQIFAKTININQQG